MELTPGSQLDRYTVESVIGEGGMGRVVRAFDTRLHRRVALKVLHIIDAHDAAGAVSSALREARAAAAIAHPNATAVYDADEVDGVPYIVMEFVPGTSLRQIIQGPMPPLTLRMRWLVDIAGALAAAHQVGIVHRDVKPENVMVREDGLVKVLDFGVARRTVAGNKTHDSVTGEHTSTPDSAGRLVGTPAYMPPEQIRGEPIDGRADQFAWGVVAYELLTGRLPWKTAREFLGYIAAVLTEKPDPPRQLAPEIPPAVEAAILRALAKNPANRFPSIGAAAAELLPFAQDPLTGAVPQPPPSFAPAEASPGRAPVLPAPPSRPSAPGRADQTPVPRSAQLFSPPSPAPPPLGHETGTPVPPAGHSSVPPARQSSPASMPSVRRTLPEGYHRLRDPRFDAPVDVDAHLALLPADAMTKGLFCIDLLRMGARAATAAELIRAAQIPERRHVAFRDYPAAENMRLTVAVAKAVFPRLPLGEGLRRLGQGTFDSVLGTHMGRSVLGILGPDIEKILLAAPKALKHLVNFGKVTSEKAGAHTYLFRVRELPAFLETFQVGVIEGALRHCRAQAKIRVALDDLATGLCEVRIG